MLMLRIEYNHVFHVIITGNLIMRHINFYILIVEILPKQFLHLRCSATDGMLPDTSIYFLRYL